jgi:ADP-ribose pyrophosphatase YjhB (NUDIX family)
MRAGGGVARRSGRKVWDLGHLWLLKAYSRLPVWLRRGVVRWLGPSYTVGSVVLVEDGDRVLLLKPSYRRAWGMPGGLLQRGESPADGARREAREELGVEICLVGRATLVVDLGPRRIDFVHRARLADPSAKPWPASPEVEAIDWFHRDALPDLLFEARTGLEALEQMDAVPYVIPVDVPSSWLD